MNWFSIVKEISEFKNYCLIWQMVIRCRVTRQLVCPGHEPHSFLRQLRLQSVVVNGAILCLCSASLRIGNHSLARLQIQTRLGCQLSLTLDPMLYQKFIQKFYQARSIQKLALCCHFPITIVWVLVRGSCYLLEVVIKCRFKRQTVVLALLNKVWGLEKLSFKRTSYA